MKKSSMVTATLVIVTTFLCLNVGGAVADTLVVDNTVSCDDITGSPYCTIKAAVDAASDDDIIEVAAGNYAEDIIVIAKKITLLGAQAGVDACAREGADESTVTPPLGAPSDTLIRLQNGSAGTIIDGFTFSGGGKQLESTSGPINDVQILNNRFIDFTTSGVFLDDNGQDITVDQNLIDGSSQAGAGGIFHLDQDNFDGLHFTNNCVSNGHTGVFSDGNRNVGESSTRSPLFSGNLLDSNGAGANLGRKSFEFATIGSNTFSNNEFDGLQGGPADSLITQNIFQGNGRYGLALTGFGGASDTTRGAQRNDITKNCFIENGFTESGAGIVFSSSQLAGTISTNNLHNNDIFGNNIGALYSGIEIINAEDNWWGAADGPSGDGSGSGDAVDGSTIDFGPWLTARASGTPCNPESFIDHFKCYRVAGGKNSHEKVYIEDEFGASKARVFKPRYICIPCSKNGSEVKTPDGFILNIYSILDYQRFKKRQMVVTDQFGEKTLKILGPSFLAVPAKKSEVPPDIGGRNYHDDDDDEDDDDD